MLICQMAALVRRALADVCTVSVLIVANVPLFESETFKIACLRQYLTY